MIFRRRRTGSFVLSGYATTAGYEGREPSWEPDDEHEQLEGALLAAQVWQGSSGPDSTVEIVRVRGDVGRVVAVVDRNGVERIGS